MWRLCERLSLAAYGMWTKVGPMRFSRSIRTALGRFQNRSRSSFVVPDRAYLEVQGRDSVKLLQGICTNDVTDLGAQGDCIAAAFLTPKGRVLADALIYNVTATDSDPSESHLVIETHESMSKGLTKFLTMYRLRSKATIKMSEDYQTVVTLPGHEKKQEKGNLSVQDPRGRTLGNLSLCHAPSGFDTGYGDHVDRSMYHRYRMMHGIAEGPEILNKIPLECNLDLLNYISFSKGCYVGQELVARTKHKGLVRKRILPFLRSLVPSSSGGDFGPLQDEILEAITTSDALDLRPDGKERLIEVGAKVTAAQAEKGEVGSVIATTQGQEMGLAMIRLENLFQAGGGLSTSTGSDITVFQPSWWPQVDPVTGKAMNEF